MDGQWGDLVCAGRRDCCLIKQRANSGLWFEVVREREDEREEGMEMHQP